uniref:C-type lectin domain-containing protein n=1 Tax=Amphilophus citrinellus TaxID=61819 RepID=A0A3Q0R3N8_AMPCI
MFFFFAFLATAAFINSGERQEMRERYGGGHAGGLATGRDAACVCGRRLHHQATQAPLQSATCPYFLTCCDDSPFSSGVCPYGWKKFGCSCYLLSPSVNTWDSSRQQCLNQGANLVIITSWEEMVSFCVFLNQLGAHLKFWIGLSKSSGGSWTWTDGRHTGTTWVFQAGQRDSWSGETCTQYLQWVCEKETVPSGQNL